MKVYREWQVCGDRQWLERMYPLAKRSMDYCIEQWDPRRRGLVEEPHHNTYDIEFWGPDGMCTSFYLGALAAMSALARDAGHPEDAAAYEALAQSWSAAYGRIDCSTGNITSSRCSTKGCVTQALSRCSLALQTS
jgi:uncharacterized protein (DUF608 family)